MSSQCPYCGHPEGDEPHPVWRRQGRRVRCRGRQKNQIVILHETRGERWGIDVLKRRRA